MKFKRDSSITFTITKSNINFSTEKKEFFVDAKSIVRQIWGKSDTILFIFAGAAAEFAVNKAVDWLYFTGALPADPIGRLFSTVSYSRTILFSEKTAALRVIDSITKIHQGVESERKATIPAWAYRDVLFMLIDYSIRSFELLERLLTPAEKDDVINVFAQLGDRMGLMKMPATYDAWEIQRQKQINENLLSSKYTEDLFLQYRKHLGGFRYNILLEAQAMVVRPRVGELVRLPKVPLLYPLLILYKMSRVVHMDAIVRNLILPLRYKKQFQALDNDIKKIAKRCPFH